MIIIQCRPVRLFPQVLARTLLRASASSKMAIKQISLVIMYTYSFSIGYGNLVLRNTCKRGQWENFASFLCFCRDISLKTILRYIATKTKEGLTVGNPKFYWREEGGLRIHKCF